MLSAYWKVILIIGTSLVFELPLLVYVTDQSSAPTRVGLIAGILAGLLLLSRIVRYFGAFLFATSAGYTLWSALSSKAAILSPLSIALLASACLQIVAAYLLVFSKSFSSEFETRAASIPSYLKTIRTAFWILIGISAAYATASDIQNLAK